HRQRGAVGRRDGALAPPGNTIEMPAITTPMSDDEFQGSGGNGTAITTPMSDDEFLNSNQVKEPAIGYGEAIQRGLVSGTPGGRAAAAAAETYLPTWLSGSPEATGSYAENYARIGKQIEQAQKQYPKTTFAAGAAPAVAGAIAAPE